MKYIAHILLLLSFLPSFSQNRILLDGSFSDWDNYPTAYADPSGDAGNSGVDFGELRISNDSSYVYLLLEVGQEINFQDLNEITLYLDTDGNPATGSGINGIGAELMYTFGQRSGLVNLAGNTQQVFHSDIGLVSAPTVSDTLFELAIDRGISFFGNPLFTGNSFRVVVKDGAVNGDVLPDEPGGISYTLSDSTMAALSAYSIAKQQPADLRVLGYNVLNDGLFDQGRIPAFTRILQAIQPDIIGFTEIYNVSSAQVAQRMETLLPSGSGTMWYHAKAGPDVHAISRYPILASYPIAGNNPGQGNGAFVIEVPDLDENLLLIVAHTPCCSNDLGREIEVDAMMAFLRNAKTGTGPLSLPPDSPIIITGDMNLVGKRRQLETLLTGNIIDETTFGPDFSPDWDGSDLIDSQPPTTHLPMTFTWYREQSSFSPGRLDYTIFSGSVLSLRNAFSLFTPTLPADSLALYSLQADDVPAASDHLPVVTDFELKNTTGVSNLENRQIELSLAVFPNPSGTHTNLSVNLPSRSSITVEIHDIFGRSRLYMLESIFPEGEHLLSVDISSFPTGTYHVKLSTPEFTVVKKLIIIR